MEYDDPLFLYFMAAIRQNMEIGSKMGVVGFIPWLKNVLPRSWTGVNLMEESVGNVLKYLKVLYFFLFDTKTLATHRADKSDTRVMLKYISREARFTTQF